MELGQTDNYGITNEKNAGIYFSGVFHLEAGEVEVTDILT